MREHHRLVKPHLKLEAKRMLSRSMPRPTHPHEQWGIDMTTVLVDGFGWVSIVLVLDCYTKKIAGYHARMPCTARHYLTALDMTMNQQCPVSTRDQGCS
jgi:putative transposase